MESDNEVIDYITQRAEYELIVSKLYKKLKNGTFSDKDREALWRAEKEVTLAFSRAVKLVQGR